MRHPPRSPLFPYTTLFRSRGLLGLARADELLGPGLDGLTRAARLERARRREADLGMRGGERSEERRVGREWRAGGGRSEGERKRGGEGDSRGVEVEASEVR